MPGDVHKSGISQELLFHSVHCVIQHREEVLLLVQFENLSRIPAWLVLESFPLLG